jgi:hypothetical protein
MADPTIPQVFIRDGNSVPITGKGLVASKAIAYTGAANLGATGATTLFTVTGDVIVNIFAVCSEDLAGATATVEVGIAGNTAALIAQTTATAIDVGEVWATATPATVLALPAERILMNSTNIIQTVATANVTDGTLTYYCLWYPLSSGSSVVAA